MPNRTYVRINGIYKRLKAAETEHFPIYIHAVVGSGKTCAVEDYFHGRDVYWLSGLGGKLDKLTPVQDIKEEAIVIDDISWITDAASQQYIYSLVEDASKQIVLMGRCEMPRWLSETFLRGKLMTADEKYLWMDDEDVLRLSHGLNVTINGAQPDKEFAQRLCQQSYGYPLLVKSMMLEIKSSGTYDENTKKRALSNCYHYFDNMFFDILTSDMRTLLLSIAEFDCFDMELIQIASQLPNAAAVIAYAVEVGDFLTIESNGNYRLRLGFKDYLLWKREVLWSEHEKQSLHKRLATYFRLHDDVLRALEQYRMAEDEQSIIGLLIQNVNKYPDVNHFYETRYYYFSLRDDVVCQHPSLMVGMSILYSLLLQQEESESWYRKLIEYSEKKELSCNDRKIAKSGIAYLDIVLPHRGSEHIDEILTNVATLVTNKTVELPTFSFTGNMPSAINGRKDFTAWCGQNKKFAEAIEELVKLALGNYGLWFLNIAMAESAFEQDSEDDYNIMAKAQSGIFPAEQAGMIDMAFAGIGVLVKLHVSHRQTEQALRLLDDLEQKARMENKMRLLPNINSLRIQIALLKNDMDQVKEWVEKEPNENTEFCILDCYRYLTKLRCYIALEECDRAWNLSNKLELYFTSYKRAYMSMENTLLRAIVAYRMNKPVWRELFQSALEKARERKFIWVIAREGIAIKPMIEALELHGDDDYMRRLLIKQKEMTCCYPRYLSRSHVLEEPMTDMENKILSLHAEGIQTDEILDILCITKRTLKFHNGNIYRKLHVKNKQEAVYAAKKLKVV